MPKKGKEKNTKNKAKHTKLMNRKLNKKREEKLARQQRLKELVKKHNELNNEES
ncbi:hypothetical protein [Flavicella marina]|uniref:hypothetical protein n=1 Tax=Flavicella marina TaxID=1475951 RepID=UPI00186B28FE|nr:hypothetical protein [Flavicella marina]